jgi:hypothetical protein
MVILRTLVLLYQFAYYSQIEWDKKSWNGKLPASFSRGKALGMFAVVEMWGLLFFFCISIPILGVPPHEFFMPMGTVIFFALTYVNGWLLGPPERVEHYRRIFDAWDERKRNRWGIYCFLIAVSMLGAFLLLMASGKNRLHTPTIAPAVNSKANSTSQGWYHGIDRWQP